MTQHTHDDLDIVFQELSSPEVSSVNPYEKFFLLSNPFPGVAQFIEGVSVGQNKIKQAFARDLREVHNSQLSRRFVITGETGAGKTNLLRDFERRIRQARRPNPEGIGLYSIYISQPQSNYFEIHRQLITQLGALFYNGLYEAEQHQKIDFSKLPADLPGINPDLINALRSMSPIGRSNQSVLFSQPGASVVPTTHAFRALDDWLQGIKLSATDKKILRVTADVIKSSTVAIKLLGDLIKIFRHAGLFRSIVILFDEFEQIFAGGSKNDQATYAQDLRNLFDSLPEGVLFVIATSPISDDLKKLSPALNRRLENPIPIEPIENEEEALEYAQAYIKAGRDRFKKETNSPAQLPNDVSEEEQAFYPLNSSEIRDVFSRLSNRPIPVRPGDFLPELNLLVYQKVYADNPQ